MREEEVKGSSGLVAAATGAAGGVVAIGAAADLVGMDESGAAAP